MSKTVTKVEKKTTIVKINKPSNDVVEELSDNEDITLGMKKDELFDSKKELKTFKTKTMSVKDLDNLDEEKSDIVEKSTIRKTKNEKYKDDQKVVLEKLKIMIGMKSNGTFLSATVSNEKKKICGEYLEEVKKYYENTIWKRIGKGESTQSAMALIRNLFLFHGYEIISREFKDGDQRGYKYYVISPEKTN
jgi:hypothetical protein